MKIHPRSPLAVAALVAVLAVPSASAFGWGWRKHKKPCPHGVPPLAGRPAGGPEQGGLLEGFFHKTGMLLHHADEIGLSPEQQASIKNWLLEAEKTKLRKSAEIEALGLDLRAALEADNPDAATVHALIDRKFAEKKALLTALADAAIAVKGSLSDEQRGKIEDFKKRRAGGGHGHGHGEGHGGRCEDPNCGSGGPGKPAPHKH